MSDTPLPHNAYAEAATLGALLIDPYFALPRIASGLAPDDFYVQKHALIYQAALGVWNSGAAVDMVSICDALAGHLTEVGGAAYLSRLVTNCPTALNVQTHIAIVQKFSRLRRIWTDCQNTMVDVLQTGADPEALRAHLVQQLLAVQEDGGVHTLFDALEGVRQQQLALADGKPIPGIDPILPGLRQCMRFGLIPPGALCIIGADPGAGKSMLATMLLLGNALLGKRVAYLGTEMPLPNLGMRMAPMLAHIAPTLTGSPAVKYGVINNDLLSFKHGPQGAKEAAQHIEKLMELAKTWIDERQLIIMDDETDIDRALAKLRAEEMRGGPFDMVVLDMIQGFSRDDDTLKTETAMDNAVSSVATRYGRRTDTVVFAISSFRKRGQGEPTIEDCRGSKQLLHDASFAILLWKDEEQAVVHDVGLKDAWDGSCIRIGKNSRFADPENSGEGTDIPFQINKKTGIIAEKYFTDPNV